MSHARDFRGLALLDLLESRRLKRRDGLRVKVFQARQVPAVRSKISGRHQGAFMSDKATISSGTNIDSILHEDRTFECPAHFSQKAHVKSVEEYEHLYT